MDGNFLKRSLTLSICFCILSGLVPACGLSPESTETSPLKPFPISPEIEAYYYKVGGEEYLGPVISPRLEEGDYVYQYTVSALLYCERGSEREDAVRFAPIGLDFNLPPYRSVSPTEGSEYSVNNVIIYGEFVPLYEKLGGGGRIGLPLSGLRYNPRQRRYEQFFEGIGIYRAEDDSPGKVKLLAYGAWKCGKACFYPVPPQAEVNLSKPIDRRVVHLVEKLGVDLTGFALSAAIKEPDGSEIVLFENVATQIRPNAGGEVKLLPLPQKLGILPQGMVANQENEEKVFLSLEGDKGHHILRSFMSYIDSHGGLEQFGLPISEPVIWEDGNIRQCFENVCLIEDRQIEGPYRVRPSPLGFEFASLFYASEFGEGGPSSLQADTPSLPIVVPNQNDQPSPEREITLEILEGRPFVDQHTAQEIGVIIRFGDQPAVNVKPWLLLSFPTGEVIHLEMPPSNNQGKSSVVVPPLQAANGTLVDYRICITTQSGKEVCARDDYLIWSPTE